MEKLCYALWRAHDETPERFNARLLGELGPALPKVGAQDVKICVADAEVAPGAGLSPDFRLRAPQAMVSFWVDSAYYRAAAEDALGGSTGRLAGFSVLESAVMPTPDPRMDGRRAAGFTQIAFFTGRPDLSRSELLAVWLDEHTAVAIETQSTFAYVQNVVVRPLTPDAPAWTCIVEETFPLEALSDQSVFFDAEGSPSRLAENYGRLMQSCARFIDFETIQLLVSGEYRFGGDSPH